MEIPNILRIIISCDSKFGTDCHHLQDIICPFKYWFILILLKKKVGWIFVL